MGIGSVFSSVANALTGGVVDKAMGMIDKLIPDKNLAQQLKSQLETLREANDHEKEMAEVALMAGQNAINLEEAKSPSIFVAGWRPAIGWTCGMGIAWAFVLKPMVEWGYFIYTGSQLIGAPTLDTSELMSLIIAMLGLAGYRTYEKKTEVARDHLK